METGCQGGQGSPRAVAPGGWMDQVTYEDFLIFPKFHSMHGRRFHRDALFFICVYSDLKCYPSFLDITGIRVLPRSFINPTLFSVFVETLRSWTYFGC